jgi:hypothetical protein
MKWPLTFNWCHQWVDFQWGITIQEMLYQQLWFIWATCCLIYFKLIVKLFLIHWSWLRLVPVEMWKWGSRWVWTVNRGCLHHQGTWSHLWYFQRSVYAHSLNCVSYRTYEIDYCLLFFTFDVRLFEWKNSLNKKKTPQAYRVTYLPKSVLKPN